MTIDEAAWRSRPGVQALAAVPGGYRFMLEGRSDVVDVLIQDGRLDLQPARSNAHAALLAVLTEARHGA